MRRPMLIKKEAPHGILVACGDTNTKDWDTGMLTTCGENMNLLSLHTYVHEVAGDPFAALGSVAGFDPQHS